MAKIKWGMAIVDGRGKLGGHVLSKNRSGAVVRTKVTPVNKQSSSQLGVRNRFTTYSQGWKALTQAQRDAWNAAVSGFTGTNIFGDTVTPSGFNLYQKLNNNLVNLGESAITSPPTPSSVGEVVATTLEAESGTQSLSLTLAGNVPANTGVKVFATAQMSAGKSYVKQAFRQITTLAAAATTPVDLLAAWQAKFGDIDQVGARISVKCVAVNLTTGQEGTPSEVTDLVEASA
jgi:hypothetical protein